MYFIDGNIYSIKYIGCVFDTTTIYHCYITESTCVFSLSTKWDRLIRNDIYL